MINSLKNPCQVRSLHSKVNSIPLHFNSTCFVYGATMSHVMIPSFCSCCHWYSNSSRCWTLRYGASSSNSSSLFLSGFPPKVFCQKTSAVKVFVRRRLGGHPKSLFEILKWSGISGRHQTGFLPSVRHARATACKRLKPSKLFRTAGTRCAGRCTDRVNDV